MTRAVAKSGTESHAISNHYENLQKFQVRRAENQTFLKNPFSQTLTLTSFFID